MKGYVIIYLFNFLIDLNQKSDEKELYKVINKKTVNILEPQKIVKLKCFNNYNKNEGNNYFLLSSPHKHMALIINVTNNFQLIENIQKIEFYKGLHSSVEFYFSNSYYLLNISKGFTLWYYDENSKLLKNKKIMPNLGQNEDKSNENIYRPIKYIENRKLFIVQIILPINSIEFYTIDTGNKEFSITLIKKITFEKERNIFSFSYNNSCLIRDKYLLIGARRNEKNGSDGGIYIINLDKFQYRYFNILNNLYNIYSLLNIRDNIIICTSEIYLVNNHEDCKYNKNKNKKRKNDSYNLINDNKNNKDKIESIKVKNNKNKKKIKDNNIINNIKDNNFKNNNIIKDNNYEENNISNNDNYLNIYESDFNDNSIIKDISNFNINNYDQTVKYKINNENLINNKNIQLTESNNNKIIKIKKNNFIPSYFRHKLVLFELTENINETININIKDELYAEFLNIDCNKMIFDSFLLCSFNKNNSVIKINENDKIFNLFNIGSPFDE